MVGAILGPAVRQSLRLLATTEERDENVSIGMAQTLRRPERPAIVSVALAAAGGGAHGAAHAQFGGGLGLRFWIGFWLGRVVVGGPGLGLSVPISAGVVAPGL